MNPVQPKDGEFDDSASGLEERRVAEPRDRTGESPPDPDNASEPGSASDGVPGAMEMTWGRTVKIWWYWAWRTALMSLIVAVIVGFVAGIALTLFGVQATTIETISGIIGAIIGAVIGIWVMKSLPEKSFSDFRVILVSREDER